MRPVRVPVLLNGHGAHAKDLFGPFVILLFQIFLKIIKWTEIMSADNQQQSPTQITHDPSDVIMWNNWP